VAVPTGLVGWTVQHFMPAGRLLSLVVVGAVCGALAVGLALLVARAPVLQALQAVLPAKGTTSPRRNGKG
jgi:hypothetical protein